MGVGMVVVVIVVDMRSIIL